MLMMVKCIQDKPLAFVCLRFLSHMYWSVYILTCMGLKSIRYSQNDSSMLGTESPTHNDQNIHHENMSM